MVFARGSGQKADLVKSFLCALVVCIAIIALLEDAAAGTYQRTIDGRTLIWNNYPKPEDRASWSGGIDGLGYAKGSGTLTWYKHEILASRYTGTMVQGKWNGVVTNEDADGKVFRGTYVNGTKLGDWVQVGVASSSSGQGRYEKTADERGAYVWNNYPKPEDQALWAGDVDEEGYARGAGIISWIKNGKWVTGYRGTMVRGKLDGVVFNEDADGKRYQGTFANGVKTSDWTQVTEFRTVYTPEQKELNRHWAAYLKEIQDGNDYANWFGRPHDVYLKKP